MSSRRDRRDPAQHLASQCDWTRYSKEGLVDCWSACHLSLVVVSPGGHRAVGLQGHSVKLSCRDRRDPAQHLASQCDWTCYSKFDSWSACHLAAPVVSP